MNQRLLVVEDNAMNLELMTEWLEAEGFEVHSAETLDSARRAFLAVNPVLVLLDIRLGAEDGVDFAMWVRQQPDQIQTPVIAVTAHALPAEQARIIRGGCSAVISKPVNFKSLRLELDRWLALMASAQA